MSCEEGLLNHQMPNKKQEERLSIRKWKYWVSVFPEQWGWAFGMTSCKYLYFRRSVLFCSIFLNKCLNKTLLCVWQIEMWDYVKRENFPWLLRIYADNLSFTGICVYQTRVKCYIRKVYLGGIYSAVTDPFPFSVSFDILWYNRRAEELTGMDSLWIFECMSHCVRIKIVDLFSICMDYRYHALCRKEKLAILWKKQKEKPFDLLNLKLETETFCGICVLFLVAVFYTSLKVISYYE